MAFEIVQFPAPPLISGELAGNWDRKDEITFRGKFAASNFVARGKEVGGVAGDLLYSNLVAEAYQVTARLGTGIVRAPFLRADLTNAMLFITNATSTANPYDAMHIVGRDAYEAIDPYRFAIPPAVKINGLIDLRGVKRTDVWFEVAGQEFAFWRFNLPYLTGTVHWKGLELWLTNVDASFYNGRAKWEGYFLIHDHPGDKDDNADFRFTAQATDADLKLLVKDLFGMTNHMEGRLTGDLVITSANSENDKSWNGYGEATLSDGYLWSVPVFGIFTPVLDAITPGESMSRVTSGAGRFAITNSVVHTRDLQVRTRAFRLNYRGSVDLVGNLDALVEAEIFRDAWLFGKAFSALLWPVSKAFEARISGTATSPKTQLRYFPRFLLAPFRALSNAGKQPLESGLKSEEPGAAGLEPEGPRPPSP